MKICRRFLFVCAGNVDRSRTGEITFKRELESLGFKVGKFDESRGFDFYVGSAGLSVAEKDIFNGSTQLTSNMVRRANRIFSIDSAITEGLRRDYNVSLKRIVQLDIQDFRNLIVEEEANSLYDEFKRKLEAYLPRK